MEISKHLIHFFLLFSSNNTYDLENDATYLSHHLISRLSILIVQFFPTRGVNSTEITKALFSSSTLEETVKIASQVLSKSVSLSPDFVLVRIGYSFYVCIIFVHIYLKWCFLFVKKLSEALLEAACFLLENSSQPSEVSLFDPLGGYYSRVCAWLGIARFLILLSLTSDVKETPRSYLNWRLIGGIIDLIDAEYQRYRTISFYYLNIEIDWSILVSFCFHSHQFWMKSCHMIIQLQVIR